MRIAGFWTKACCPSEAEGQAPTLPHDMGLRATYFVRAVVIAIMVANGALFWACSRGRFASVEEVRSIPAGLALWRLGTFALSADSPPLSRMVAILPALGFELDKEIDNLINHVLYKQSPVTCLQGEVDEAACAWIAESDFRRLEDLLDATRLMGYLWWLLGAGVIYRWARSWYGDKAGLLGMALWCFDPSVLSRESLATPDLPAAVVLVAASYAFSSYLRSCVWDRAIFSGILLGIAQLADFSLLALYVIWPIVYVIHHAMMAWGGRSHRTLTSLSESGGTSGAVGPVSHLDATPHPRSSAARLRRMGSSAGHAVLMAWMSIVTINLGYGAADSGYRLGDYEFVSRTLAGPPPTGVILSEACCTGNRFRNTPLGHVAVPLPAAYILGIDRRLLEAETHWYPRAHGAGLTDRGVFDPASMLARIPLGTYVIVAWGLALILLGHHRCASRADELTIWLPIVLVAMLASLGFAPSGFGPLLFLPLAFVGASKVACFCRPGRWRSGGLLIILLIWSVASSLSTFPYFSSYLNEAVGGPSDVAAQVRYGGRGVGHDLPALKEWAVTHPEARPLRVAIRHPIDAISYLRSSIPPQMRPLTGVSHATPAAEINAGYYAIDAFHLSLAKFEQMTACERVARIGDSTVIFRVTEADAIRYRTPTTATPAETTSDRNDEQRDVFQYRALQDDSGARRHYAVFVPASYRSDRPHPLILFLHGSGDAGKEGRLYLKVGLPDILQRTGRPSGAIVVCPQGWTGSWATGSEDAAWAMKALTAAEREFNVDPQRVYLTGLSSGGAGTWNLAAAYPQRWAAIVPVATVGSPLGAEEAHRIKEIPCWCLQNCNDKIGLAALTRASIDALRVAGGRPCYTEMLRRGTALEPNSHNAWTRAYSKSELFDWLQQQRRP